MEPTEIITMLRANLAEIWDEHQDDPELGRKRLGMWKDQAKRRICRFSPERATEFWNLHGNPHSQIEDKAEREYKIFQSEVEEYDRYLAALQMHAKDFPRFWQVEAEAQKPIAEAAGTPTPQMSAADDTDVRIGILSVPLKPQEVHRHLVNLCNKDGRFAIWDPKPTDESLEKLLVFDAQKLKKANSYAEKMQAVIGTVRLLPWVGDGTTMIFDAKDAEWHQKITAEKRALFHEFFQRNKDYWKRLLAGEIKPAEERDTTPAPAEGGAGKLRGPIVKTGGGEVESLLSRYTLGALQSLKTEVTPGKVLLFWLAQDLLSHPPDEMAVEVARRLFKDYIDEGLGYGVSESDILREMAEVILHSMPDEETAAKKSTDAIHGWELVSDRHKQLIKEVESLLIDDLETLILGLPLIKKFKHDYYRHQDSDADRDSGHYAYPPEKRREIVKQYRQARLEGEVLNKDSWAKANYQISGKTLLAYEREFPTPEET